MVSVSAPAGVLIQGHCCALMLELLFGHVSLPAERSAVLTVVCVPAWSAVYYACFMLLYACILLLLYARILLLLLYACFFMLLYASCMLMYARILLLYCCMLVLCSSLLDYAAVCLLIIMLIWFMHVLCFVTQTDILPTPFGECDTHKGTTEFVFSQHTPPPPPPPLHA